MLAAASPWARLLHALLWWRASSRAFPHAQGRLCWPLLVLQLVEVVLLSHLPVVLLSHLPPVVLMSHLPVVLLMSHLPVVLVVLLLPPPLSHHPHVLLPLLLLLLSPLPGLPPAVHSWPPPCPHSLTFPWVQE